MAKLKIDTDVIKNKLVPQVNGAYNNVKLSKNMADRVKFPNDEYNFKNIASQIDDCCDKTKKYAQWMNDKANSIVKDINNGIEEINNTTVEELNIMDIVVK